MLVRWAVERGGDDLAGHRAGEFGDFLWALADKDEHEVAFRVVLGYPVGDCLQHGGLAGLRRGHDQGPLSLADRHEQVDYPGGQAVRFGLQEQTLVRVERHQFGERRSGKGVAWVLAVDGGDLDQGCEFVAFAGGAGCAGDRVASAQPVCADQAG